MQIQKIKVDQFRLGDLMLDIQRGRLRIPSFQREFVWERTRIQKLLDSMYNEYPIGTLFFWEAPARYNHLLRDVEYLGQPPFIEDQNYTLILDGQQRLTSLYAVVKGLTVEGENYGKIVVDLANPNSGDKLSFQYRAPDNQRWIAVRDLLSSEIEIYFPIYNRLPDDYRRQFELYRSRLSNYPFSVVIVRGMEIEDAIEIFERINQQGRRLSRYDMIAASVLTDTFDLRRRTESDIVGKLRDSFGVIEETIIPQALALNIRGNTTYETQMSLKSDEVQKAWERTVDCLKLAIDFVRDNLGVARADFLPYDGILPVLAYYFYHANSSAILSPEHRVQLERWFWRVTFSDRYGGSTQTLMSEDAAWIRELIEKGRQFDYPINTTADTLIESSMRYTTSAMRNGILCLLNLRRPLHFENATEISLTNENSSEFTRAERHHIFPVGFLQRQGWNKRDVHLIPNFCFIPVELNRRIADTPPSVYMSKIRDAYGDPYEFEKVMHSHLIPVDEGSGIWTDDYERFLMQRAKLLADEIRHLCGIAARIEKEQRNPIIDALEAAIRDMIHDTLRNAYGFDYWRDGVASVAGEVHKSITERVEDYVQSTAGVSKSQFNDPRLRLDFCDISDYPKIILRGKNWSLFAPMFRSKQDCERYFDDFRDFRNATKHNRELDSVLEHRGQAAIIWLARAVGADLSQYGIV